MKRLVLVAVFAVLVGTVSAETFNPGDQIVATFTAAPNTSNLLLFFNNDALTITGTPTLELTLFNGGSTLGSLTYSGIVTPSFDGYFKPPATPVLDNFTPFGNADFTSINNGTINGRLVWTISGGSVSGFSMSDFVLYDATETVNGYGPNRNITSQITLNPVPEPSGLLLLGSGGLGLLGLMRRKFRA